MDATLLDTKSICSRYARSSNAEDFAKWWKDDFNGLPLSFIKRFQQIASENKVNIGADKICERYVSAGIAVVKFQLADSNVIKIKKQLRTTIGEVFGSVGKISCNTNWEFVF